MSKLTLYSARACPFAHRTRLVLAAKGLTFEVVEIDLQNKPAWFTTNVSGYGKVPALAHDGNHLWESAVINEYLEEVFPTPGLLPKEPGARARARIWIDYANTRFAPAFGALLRAQGEAERSKAKSELTAVLQQIETEGLGKGERAGAFFLGEQLSLVDFAFYPWLERWDALAHYRDITIPRGSKLEAWRSALASLDAVKGQANGTDFYVERYAKQANPEKAADKRAPVAQSPAAKA